MPKPPKPGPTIIAMKSNLIFSDGAHKHGAAKRRVELTARLKKMPSIETIRKKAAINLPRAVQSKGKLDSGQLLTSSPMLREIKLAALEFLINTYNEVITNRSPIVSKGFQHELGMFIVDLNLEQVIIRRLHTLNLNIESLL